MAVALWSPTTDLARDTSVPLTTLMQQGAAADNAELQARQAQDQDARANLIAQTIGKHTTIGPNGTAAVDRQSILQELQQRDPVAATQAQQHFVALDQAAQQASDAHLKTGAAVVHANDEHTAAMGAEQTRVLGLVRNELGNIDPNSPNVEAQWNAAVMRLKANGVQVPDNEAQYSPEALASLRSTLIGAKDQYDTEHKPRYDSVTTQIGDHQFRRDTFDKTTGELIGDNPTGGTPAPSGAPVAPANPGVRRVMGWTPRASQGGDNSDTAVDNKVATLTRAVGAASPDAPLTQQQLVALAQALPATEGNANSLTGRINNPGGIKDGKFAQSQPGYAGAVNGYAKFDSPASGTAAMTNLLGKFYNRGQRSVRDIIEGRPVSGPTPTAVAASGAPQAPGSVFVGRHSIIPGPPAADPNDMTEDERQYTAMELALGGPMPQLGNGQGKLKADLLGRKNKILADAGISPGEAIVMGAQNKAGLAELIKTGQMRAVVAPAEETAVANADQVLRTMGKGASGSVPVINRYAQYVRGQYKGDPDVSRYHTAIVTFTTEYAKVMTAVGNTPLSDSARHEVEGLLNGTMTPQQVTSTISQMKIDMNNRMSGIETHRQEVLNQLRTGGGVAPAGRLTNAPSGPQIGTVRGKWRFKGGNPASPGSWEAIH